MIKTFAITAALLGAFASVPSAAVTYDAFASFNGTNGNGGFVYGYTNSVTTTAFDTSLTTLSGGCALSGPTTCLTSAAYGVLPQASVGGSFSTVNVPTDAVLLHPGDSDNLSVYASFVSGVSTTYSYSIAVQSRGMDTTSIGYTPFTSIGGVVTLGTRGVITNYLDAVSITGSTALIAGQSFGIIIDRNGNYGGDSTGVNLTLATVPEPATWGLMITGFGLVGLGMRRKAALTA